MEAEHPPAEPFTAPGKSENDQEPKGQGEGDHDGIEIGQPKDRLASRNHHVLPGNSEDVIDVPAITGDVQDQGAEADSQPGGQREDNFTPTRQIYQGPDAHGQSHEHGRLLGQK